MGNKNNLPYWLPPRIFWAAGIFFAAVLGITLGVFMFTFRYAAGLSYFSSDPRACANCHIMQSQFDSWQKSSHHGVAVCVDCHLPHDVLHKYLAKAENGYHHSKGFTFQDFHEPILIKPKNSKILHENCISCHRDMVHDLIVGATSDKGSVSCVHCHQGVGHGAPAGLGGADHDYPREFEQSLNKSHVFGR